LLSIGGSDSTSFTVMKNLTMAIKTRVKNIAPSISFGVYFMIVPLRLAPTAPPIARDNPFFIFKRPFFIV